VNGAAVVAIDNSRFVKNGLGLSPGYAGVDQTAGLLFVGGTEFTGAGYSGISVRNAAQSVIERSHFSHFQYGVISYDTAVVRLSHTTVVENVYGIFTDNTAFTETFGNNEIRGNNINFSGSGPVNPVALQ
jgi:hypothetical protein